MPGRDERKPVRGQGAEPLGAREFCECRFARRTDVCPFTEAEIREAHRDEIRDPRKRTHRCAPWRSHETERGEPLPFRFVTPLPGMQRTNRGSEMEMLRQRLGEGALEFVPGFGWIYAS